MHAVAQADEHKHHDEHHSQRLKHGINLPTISAGIPDPEVAQGEVKEQVVVFYHFAWKISAIVRINFDIFHQFDLQYP
jgi:hypothetical protein